jgi:hypothetical protein
MIIELTIKTDYLPGWGTYEGVRELVQNGKDAETELSAPFSAQHFGNTLCLSNTGTRLPREALLMGHTTKRGNNELIGKFGEGLKLGVLALVRAGHTVVIENGDETWKPVLRRSKIFDSPVLAFSITRKRTPVDGVRVRVTGIQKDQWTEFKSRFLFLSDVDGRDTLLTGPEYAGKMFVKGIYVCNKPGWKFGYSFQNAAVDRDRNMVDEFDAMWYSSYIWANRLKHEPSLDGEFYKLLLSDAGDLDYLKRGGQTFPDHTLDYVHQEFIKSHGEDAWPCANAGEVTKVSFLGKRGVITPECLRRVLEKRMGTVDDLRSAFSQETEKVYAMHELSAEEQAVYNRARDLLSMVYPPGNGADYLVVDFRSGNIEGLYNRAGGAISVSRKCLDSVAHCLRTLIHEAAHEASGDGDGTIGHQSKIEELWSNLTEKLIHDDR